MSSSCSDLTAIYIVAKLISTNQKTKSHGPTSDGKVILSYLAWLVYQLYVKFKNSDSLYTFHNNKCHSLISSQFASCVFRKHILI